MPGATTATAVPFVYACGSGQIRGRVVACGGGAGAGPTRAKCTKMIVTAVAIKIGN